MTRKIQIMLTMLIVVSAMLISGCEVLFGSTFDPGCDASLDDIVASLQPELPASATALEESCTEGFAPGNATVRVTFTMTPEELEAFMQGTPITEWQETVPADYTYNGAPFSPASAIYGDYGDGAIYTEILIDISDPALYTVYYSNSFVD